MRFFLIFLSFAIFIKDSFALDQVKRFIEPINKAPVISSTINPIYQISKFISGDEKNNHLLLSPRYSAHNSRFVGSDIGFLNNSNIVFYIGNNLENNFEKAYLGLTNKPIRIRLIDAKEIDLISFQTRFNQESVDYHIWLSPSNAVIIAQEITEILSILNPNQEKFYQNNFSQFKNDITAMDQRNRKKLLEILPESFVIDHDNTAYLEKYYDLKAAGVMRYSHDNDLRASEVNRINNLLKNNNIKCILGSIQEKNNLTKQFASNHKKNLIFADMMGEKRTGNKNGYVLMINALIDDLVKCVNE